MAKYRYEDELDDYEVVPKKTKKNARAGESGRNAARRGQAEYAEDVRHRRYADDYDRRESRRAGRGDYDDYGSQSSRRNADDYEPRRRRDYDDYDEPHRRRDYDEPRRRKKKKHPVLRFFRNLIILAIILAILLGVLVFRYYGLSNFVRDDSTKSSQVDLPSNNGMYNILLIGVDRRDTSWSGNSDSMILLSINSKQRKVYMISFMRDLYAEIPGYGGNKLNAACAIGGPSLLVQTIEENFRVNIDSYAAVDFASMIKIVDLLGGVTVEVSAEEAEVANGYILDMANTIGEDASPHLFTEYGTVNCDGYQAVAFSRIRYVGNSDYERTERQRTVLAAMMSKMKHMNPLELNTFVQNVMPYVMHNIDSASMLKLTPQLALMLLYPTVQDRVPYDDLYYVDGEYLVPDYDATRQRLYDTLYG